MSILYFRVVSTCLQFYDILEVMMNQVVAMFWDRRQSYNTDVVVDWLKFESIVDDKTMVVHERVAKVINIIALSICG